ncbi:plasmid replication protein RepC [Gemmobacter sp.]|uniref:plasmid replication protein RepC n=1 Tax=Gemmobacter sp. TaxID=1898957 RepID=UPI002AFEFD3E|nr:plasmid replication protein RepC [Gemmobacter sp.]
MAFIQISAPVQARDGVALSADNALPDRFALIDLVRRAAPLIGLKAPVIATLDALLSCLPPRRTHHVVFASNQTLAFRRDGISDRTLRRHFALLEEAGFLTRHDSPNGKRFTRHDSAAGVALRFGLDLAPLFAQVAELTARATAASQQAERLAYLRMKLRVAIARAMAGNPDDPAALAAQPLLRRKQSADDLTAAIATLRNSAPVDNPGAPPAPDTNLSATDGQNVRHHQKSKEEPIEKDPASGEPLNIPILLDTCPDAAEFAMTPITTPTDVIDHAAMLAPMMGIDRATYRTAETRLGALPSALTIWMILSMRGKVQQAGAYFRALTLGKRSNGFDPWQVILRMHRRAMAMPPDCPRTTA